MKFDAIIARTHSVELAQEIKHLAIPAVALESGTEDLAKANPLRRFSEILADALKIAQMAAEHLVGQGLQSFAFCGFENAPWSRAREREFERYLKLMGFPCVKHRTNIRNWMRYADWTRSWSHERHVLAAWIKSLPLPTGLMACNDMCGRQVLEACADAGVSVPAQLAVVGVDNDELLCELSDPPLSSVALDVEKAGYEASRLLDLLMSGEIRSTKQVVAVNPLRVVMRRSSDIIVKDDPLVGDAIRFIEDHAGRGIGVPDVASEMDVSRRTLERRFSRAIHRSVLTEINRCRLDRAKRLLQETNLPVCRVASEAGFANARMFNRIFRRVENFPPSSYRRKLQEGSTADRQGA
jgi:LacI family transcriptional regulator